MLDKTAMMTVTMEAQVTADVVREFEEDEIVALSEEFKMRIEKVLNDHGLRPGTHVNMSFRYTRAKEARSSHHKRKKGTRKPDNDLPEETEELLD